MRRLHGTGRCAAAAFGCAALLACFGARTVRTTVFDEGGVRVLLRHEKRAEGGGSFSHPAIISPVRLARILANIDVEERGGEKGERRHVIPTALVYTLGEGLSAALAEAAPHQEVVAMAVETRRRFGIFTADYLTSFIAWVDGEELWIRLGEVDRALSSEPGVRPPEPSRDEANRRYRVRPASGLRAMRAVGRQAVAVSWRDEYFGTSGALRIDSRGRLKRRTILLDSGEEEDQAP